MSAVMPSSATRTHAANRFSTPMLVLHWLIFVLMAAAYATMEFRGLVPREGRFAMRAAHYSLGLAVLALVLVRIAMRRSHGAPPIVPAPSALNAAAAKAGHLALYVLMIVLPVLGWLAYGAEGRVVAPFGVPLPMPIAPNQDWVKPLEGAHEIAGKIGYVLVGLHAAAALWHHYFVRDNTLALMWPPAGRGGRSSA
jgi:cytochrome b561